MYNTYIYILYTIFIYIFIVISITRQVNFLELRNAVRLNYYSNIIIKFDAQ